MRRSTDNLKFRQNEHAKKFGDFPYSNSCFSITTGMISSTKVAIENVCVCEQ